ncbi:MAG TPA: HAD-IIA family hydrolase [Mycobacteriales bacterium]|nr:HAD-IIA family hydrolase [Mycobacteriales bacterium]
MQAPRTRLGRSSRPLVEEYDAALVDLDGVVYVGPDAVPGAADALTRARAAGMSIAFVTNNASRTPDGVAAHLLSVGVDASPDQVATSAQAAARLLGERIAPGSSVLVVGGIGLVEAAAEAGYDVVRSADDVPAAVLQGYTAETTYADLAEAALAIRHGALWVAANTDATMPSPRGQVPGNGALVAALMVATGRVPLVAGKPELALHAESVARVRSVRPLVVGDRLETDVEGAVRASCDSLLVLSGVTDVEMLMSAPPHRRPTYVAADLRGLLLTHGDGMDDGLDDVRAGIEGAWAALSGSGAASE